MGYKALHWAWELPLKSTDKFVLIALADLADEKHSCYPGQKALAAMTGASEVTVRRAIARMEEQGLLTREERRNEAGYKSSDRYFLQVGVSLESHRSIRPVGDDLTGQPGQISPVTQDDLTGQSDRYIEEYPPETHQRPTSGPRKRGTRIPDPFLLTAEMKAWAAAEVPGLDVVAHTREFVDHWRGESGAKATKLDWVAAWRNWMRKAHRWNAPKQQRATPDDRVRDGLDRGARLAALTAVGVSA
ncbi:MAG: helix-turn-helix domain-containing protein [Actinobacteria bacterium]|nr:helix-turn-helix domain-containing protein [Actinomycetota bacterium]